MKYILSFIIGGTIGCIVFVVFSIIFLQNEKINKTDIDTIIKQSQAQSHKASKIDRNIAENLIVKSDNNLHSKSKNITDNRQKSVNAQQKEKYIQRYKHEEDVKINPLQVGNSSETKEDLFKPLGINGTYTQDQIRKITNLTREEKIQHMIDTGMTRDQIEKGMFIDFEYTGADPMKEISDIGRRMQSSIYGTREFFDGLQRMIRAHENHPIPILRGLAEFMKPRDADGNEITTWEAYKNNLKIDLTD